MAQAESLFPSLRQLIKDARTPVAAVGDLTDFIKPLGCSSVDCVMSDRVLQRWGKSPIRHVYYHAGFPKDWDQRWPRYSMVDPLIPATSISQWPVNIHRLKGSTGGSALQREFWSYLESSGVAYGTAIPVHLPGGAFAGIAFYQSESDVDLDNDDRDDRLFMIGQFFCRALADRFALLPQQEISLTDREVECLYWTSVGKTTEEIALIIGRATQTVRFHLESASKKLGAVNRTSAVAQACSRGFINPH